MKWFSLLALIAALALPPLSAQAARPLPLTNAKLASLIAAGKCRDLRLSTIVNEGSPSQSGASRNTALTVTLNERELIAYTPKAAGQSIVTVRSGITARAGWLLFVGGHIDSDQFESTHESPLDQLILTASKLELLVSWGGLGDRPVTLMLEIYDANNESASALLKLDGFRATCD